MDNKGKGKTQLTDNGNKKYMPAWSYDGGYILYTELKSLEGEAVFGQKKGAGQERYVIMMASIE